MKSTIKTPIFLIGMPLSGKSTVGKVLAEGMALEFIDLDKAIEKSEEMKVHEIFSTKGAAYFRLMEHQLLNNLNLNYPRVIALGGGTPIYFDNMGYILSKGIVICLDISSKMAFERFQKSKEIRPLLEDFMVDWETLLIKRASVYDEAHFKVKDLSEPSQIVQLVDKIMKKR